MVNSFNAASSLVYSINEFLISFILPFFSSVLGTFIIGTLFCFCVFFLVKFLCVGGCRR